MIFTILDKHEKYPLGIVDNVYLTWDDWNDYNFYTLFGIFYVDENSIKHNLGGIKIAHFGQKENTRVFNIGDSFIHLDDRYFSMGATQEYYEQLNQLGSRVRDIILTNLNDIAKNDEIYERAIFESVTKKSFFRTIRPATVTGQFRRMAAGGAKLTRYSFQFNLSKPGNNKSFIDLSFAVEPESFPPTNIHVLIGRNGVGKTHLVNNMINALVGSEIERKESGTFVFDEDKDSEATASLFANLISVSFSAFDETEPKSQIEDLIYGIKYAYIGLRQIPTISTSSLGPKTTQMLTQEFIDSLNACMAGALTERWKKGIRMLESDPNFKDAGISKLIEIENKEDFNAAASNVFRRLSSGHKIVLLTITRLIETLQERSLVLMDEPESHLHPPLLSAFIRSVSELLIITNGVAIIATHSPVVLQEVPKSCIWKLRRSGAEIAAERLLTESFGENVGVLTNDIFGLEVTESGFYKMLSRVTIENNYSYESVLQVFNNQLGMEGRAIVMAIIANRTNE